MLCILTKYNYNPLAPLIAIGFSDVEDELRSYKKNTRKLYGSMVQTRKNISLDNFGIRKLAKKFSQATNSLLSHKCVRILVLYIAFRKRTELESMIWICYLLQQEEFYERDFHYREQPCIQSTFKILKTKKKKNKNKCTPDVRVSTAQIFFYNLVHFVLRLLSVINELCALR